MVSLLNVTTRCCKRLQPNKMFRILELIKSLITEHNGAKMYQKIFTKSLNIESLATRWCGNLINWRTFFVIAYIKINFLPSGFWALFLSWEHRLKNQYQPQTNYSADVHNSALQISAPFVGLNRNFRDAFELITITSLHNILSFIQHFIKDSNHKSLAEGCRDWRKTFASFRCWETISKGNSVIYLVLLFFLPTYWILE